MLKESTAQGDRGRRRDEALLGQSLFEERLKGGSELGSEDTAGLRNWKASSVGSHNERVQIREGSGFQDKGLDFISKVRSPSLCALDTLDSHCPC